MPQASVNKVGHFLLSADSSQQEGEGNVRKRVVAIALEVRHKGVEGERKRQQEYRQLLRLTRQILNDSRRVLRGVEALPTRRRRGVQGLGEGLETMADQVRRVVRQTQIPGMP